MTAVKFTDHNSIGGEISFGVFPTGWDKTLCLWHVEDEAFEEIHSRYARYLIATPFLKLALFVKTQGSNDYEIFTDKRTRGRPADVRGSVLE